MTPERESHSSRKTSSLVLIFSLFVAGVFLFFALRNIDWATFWRTILAGHYELILITVPLCSFTYFVRSLRWSILICSERRVPVSQVFWANMVGYLGNYYLPARAGELLRSAFLGRRSGLGTSFVLANAMTERILDTIALVLIGSCALLSQKSISPLLADAVRIMAILGFTALLALLFMPSQERALLKAFSKIPLPTALSEKISYQISRFLVGMRSLQNMSRFLLFEILTAVIWLLDGIGTVVGALIISQKLDLGQALMLVSALGLSSAIPAPGHIGVYQFVAVTVLPPFGFSRSNALAFILISEILSYLTVGFWGLLGIWQINRADKVPIDPEGKTSEK